jgi:putative molybdopterin biosynthesis protein
MKSFLTTKEVAQFLNLNEKMIYTLVADKGLPASKITGKWLFPRRLVEQWVEAHTLNYPKFEAGGQPAEGVLIITGSNDMLLDKALALFNSRQRDHVAVFGNLGSMGGLQALRRNLCHMAGCHLLQENETDYNFAFADQELDKMPAVVNFCRREQGIVVQSGNPKNISNVEDLGRSGIRIVNRPLGTGTRLLLDRELKKAGIKGEKVDGYTRELGRHLDVGLEVYAGRADAGPAIRPVASLLGLDFIPIRWERYDLLVAKERFFEPPVQLFLGLLHEAEFQHQAAALQGYDLEISGKMIYPNDQPAADDSEFRKTGSYLKHPKTICSRH